MRRVRHTERKYADTIMIMNQFTEQIMAYMQYLKFNKRGLKPRPLRGRKEYRDDKEGY